MGEYKKLIEELADEDKKLDASIAQHKADLKEYRAKRALKRKEAREYAPLREALIQWINQGWTCVAAAASYLRQHSAGGMSSPYWMLSNRDQVAVVRLMLEGLHREKLADRAWGPGEKKSEVMTYIARSLTSKEGHS